MGKSANTIICGEMKGGIDQIEAFLDDKYSQKRIT